MRFAMFLAALLLWVQPAKAIEILDASYTGTITSGAYSWYNNFTHDYGEYDLAGQAFSMKFTAYTYLYDPTPPPIEYQIMTIYFFTSSLGADAQSTLGDARYSLSEADGILRFIGLAASRITDDVVEVDMSGAIVNGTVPSWTGTLSGYHYVNWPTTNAHYNFSFELTRGSSTITGLSVVPEPSTWALLILGIGVTGGALRTMRPSRSRQANPI